MRDTFRKELAKTPKKRSGDEGGVIKESKWAYFKCMEFLKDQFQRRQLQGNVPNVAIFDEDIQNSTTTFPPDPTEVENESQAQSLESSQNITNETPTLNYDTPQRKIAKMNNATVVKKLMMLEEQKIQIFKERNSASLNQDPDYHFLMSLLPYLRKVPEERKMIVRTKLQQVFCEEDLLGFIHRPTHSSTSDSWASGSHVETPMSRTPDHEDLASYFAGVRPDATN